MLALRRPRRRRRRAPDRPVGGARGPQPAASTSTPEVGVEHALVGAGPRRACPSAMRRPKSSTTTRSQTDITRSMWCSTSSTAMSPRRRADALAQLVACRRRRARRPARRAAAARGSADERARQRDALLDAGTAGSPGSRPATSATPSASSASSAAARSARSSRSERGSPSRAEARPARRPALGAGHDVLQRRQPGEEPDALKRAGDAEAGELRAGGPCAASARATRRSPSSGRTKPQMTLKSVVLPAPLGPMTPTTSPGETVERHAPRGRSGRRSGTVTASMRSPSPSTPWSAVTTFRSYPTAGTSTPSGAWRHGMGREALAHRAPRPKLGRARVVEAPQRRLSAGAACRTGSARRASGSSPVMMSR